MKGLGEGFYSNPNELISKQCLDAESIRAIDNLLEGFRHGKDLFDKIAKSMTAIVTLFVSVFNNCRATQFVYDMISICFMTNTCAGFALFANICSHINEISIAVSQLILNIALFWSPDRLEDLSTKYYGLG
jgi:hypothetical protein